MATTQTATTHDQHKSPTASPQLPQGQTPGQRQPEQGSEPSLPLHRYLGNSYMQALSTTTRRLGLQTKLTVNEPGDIYEQEADRVAARVMAAPTHANVCSAPLQIQRFSNSSHGQTDAPPASVGQTLASPGRPLEPLLRQDMEQRFGYDFSQVRVHTGAAAGQSARDVNAHAYTLGHNIVFGAGQFAPGTAEGRRLIAHELTHVIQQTGHGAPFIQRKEKKDQSDTKTVTQITVEAKTTGEEKGRALTSDGATYYINIVVNNLSPGRITTGKLLLGSSPETWREIHLGSESANQFVYLLPPGVTLGQTTTIIVEPPVRERAEAQIRALNKPVRDFFTREGGRKASEQELLQLASAGRILEKQGVTENELLLEQQRRMDREALGLPPAEISDPVDWALSYLGHRKQARAAEHANATTLLEAAQRLSLASSDLARFIRGTGVLTILDPDSKKLAISLKLQIPKLNADRPDSAFRNLGELQSVLRTFENALIADLRALAASFLDDTEAGLIGMQHQFIGRGGKGWGPGYLEDEIAKVKSDPDVIKVQKEHEEYVKLMDRDEQYDLESYNETVSAEDVDLQEPLYHARQKERQKERKKEKERYDTLLRETVAKKSKLKILPGLDVNDLLSANGGRRAQVLLNNYIVDGRKKVREAREKLSDAKFLYAADKVIDKEKELFSKAPGIKSDIVNGIIDQFARERRAEKTIWQELWDIFQFVANFIPGPIGWVARGLGAVVEFDKNISAAGNQDRLSSTGLSNVTADPNAGLKALGKAAVQIVTDVPGAAKGARRLTLGLSETSGREAAELAGQGVATVGKRELTQAGDEAARLGEQGVATTPAKQVTKPPVPEVKYDDLPKPPPANNTDIDRALSAKPRPPTPPRQPTAAPAASRPVAANENVAEEVAEQELAAAANYGPVGPRVVKGDKPQDPANLRIVASGGGNPPGGRTPTPGTVRPAETPASARTQTPAATPSRVDESPVPKDTPAKPTSELHPVDKPLEQAPAAREVPAAEQTVAPATGERAVSEQGMTPDQRLWLEREVADAENTAEKASRSAAAQRGQATKLEQAGKTGEAAAAGARAKVLEEQAAKARRDAQLARDLLNAEPEAAEAAASLAQQQKLRQRIQELDNELSRRRSKPYEVSGPRSLGVIRNELESAKKELARVIEATKGWTEARKSYLRTRTPFKGIGGAERERAFLEGLPKQSKGPNNTFVDYVTGKLHPRSELHPDHVVSVDEIFQMEGFGKLSRNDQLEILDIPENLRFLQSSLNESKRHTSLTKWLSKASADELKNLTAAQREALADLEAKARTAIKDEIARRRATRSVL